MLRAERLESRDCPAFVANLFGGVLSVEILGPNIHTASVDQPTPGTTVVTVDGAPAIAVPTSQVAFALVVGSQDVTARNVIQNNTPLNIAEVGGPNDDTLFGGTGAVNALYGLGGSNIIYSILGGTQAFSVSPADHVFVNPNSSVVAPPGVPVVTFFKPNRTVGTPYIGQEADGVLYVTTANAGGFFELDPVAPGVVLATYDLGDGAGTRFAAFNNVVAVSFFGGSGRDVYINNTPISEAAYGGGGDDVMLGGVAAPDGSDVHLLKGRDGNDFVAGRGSRNDLSGNAGNDVIVLGGPHVEDTVRTGPGDTVVGVTATTAVISP